MSSPQARPKPSRAPLALFRGHAFSPPFQSTSPASATGTTQDPVIIRDDHVAGVDPARPPQTTRHIDRTDRLLHRALRANPLRPDGKSHRPQIPRVPDTARGDPAPGIPSPSPRSPEDSPKYPSEQGLVGASTRMSPARSCSMATCHHPVVAGAARIWWRQTPQPQHLVVSAGSTGASAPAAPSPHAPSQPRLFQAFSTDIRIRARNLRHHHHPLQRAPPHNPSTQRGKTLSNPSA